MSNKLYELFANGTISIDDLKEGNELIERAEFVLKAVEACKKTITFPLGTSKIGCYNYAEKNGEYSSWGEVDIAGLFTCYSNWNGYHVVGRCYLTQVSSVFLSLEDKDFQYDLKRFLEEQIKKAEKSQQ